MSYALTIVLHEALSIQYNRLVLYMCTSDMLKWIYELLIKSYFVIIEWCKGVGGVNFPHHLEPPSFSFQTAGSILLHRSDCSRKISGRITDPVHSCQKHSATFLVFHHMFNGTCTSWREITLLENWSVWFPCRLLMDEHKILKISVFLSIHLIQFGDQNNSSERICLKQKLNRGKDWAAF